jgi:hypothetical protein
MQPQADATGKLLRSSETRLVSLAPQTGLDRMWVELAVRSLGLRCDKIPRLRAAQPSWGRIASLLLEPGQCTF